MASGRKQIEPGEIPALCQRWLETEQDWGIRPDGFSLHLSVAGLRQFIAHREGLRDASPREFSYPTGRAYVVGINATLAARIEASAHGGLPLYIDYECPAPDSAPAWTPVGDIPQPLQ